MTPIDPAIDEIWERRDGLGPDDEDARKIVVTAIDQLDSGATGGDTAILTTPMVSPVAVPVATGMRSRSRVGWLVAALVVVVALLVSPARAQGLVLGKA